VFSFWDRLFGTFRNQTIQSGETLRFGLDEVSRERSGSFDAQLRLPFYAFLIGSPFLQHGPSFSAGDVGKSEDMAEGRTGHGLGRHVTAPQAALALRRCNASRISGIRSLPK